MKIMKKMTALLLALLMVMGMLVTTAMADEHTITIENPAAGHTYKAYQIFRGEVFGGVVSDIAWGSDIDKVSFVAALQDHNTPFSDQFPADANVYTSNANQIGNVIKEWSHNEDNIQLFADIAKEHIILGNTVAEVTANNAGSPCVLTLPSSGYYLVVDTTTTDDSDRITDYLLLISGTSTKIKYSPAGFNMTVNYRKDGTFNNYVDLEVGASAFIKLEASLSTLYEDYNQYYLGFKTTLPAGLTFADFDDDVVAEAYILHTNGKTTAIDPIHNEYKVKFDGDKTVFVDFGNILDEAATGQPDMLDDDKLVVKLEAKVSSNNIEFGKGTAPGNVGNKITSEMIYTNNMNQPDFDHTQINESNTDKDHWTDFITHSKISDTASVYTYQIKFQKQDSTNEKPLAGATFRLIRTETNDQNQHTYYYATFQQDNTDNSIYRVTGWEQKSDAATPTDLTILTSSAVSETGGNYTGGTFTIQGLDAQSYSLEEVTPPSGYNKMQQPVGIAIRSNFENDVLTELYANVDSTRIEGAEETGLISLAPIKNTPGASLPTTGGMGTTIFYIVGGVLVLGAGAAFVMKRRNEEI